MWYIESKDYNWGSLNHANTLFKLKHNKCYKICEKLFVFEMKITLYEQRDMPMMWGSLIVSEGNEAWWKG